MTAPIEVLFAAPVEPWCRENGSSLIIADLLESLGAIDRVTLLPVFARRPPEGYERRPPPDLDGVFLDVPGLPRWISVARAAVHHSSPLRHRFDNRSVATRILEAINKRGFHPDLVHVEHLPLLDIGLRIARELDRPLVYRAHNIESKLWARRLGLPAPLKRPIISHMERSEACGIRAADLSLFISEGDLSWARANAPGSRCALLPCSLRVERYENVEVGTRAFDDQMCFVGGLDWAPNEDGLRWFVQDVLPKVALRLPSAGLAILSRGAGDRAWLRDNAAIAIVPDVTAAASLFAASHVSVAPLLQGGGVRIKIPESLAVGCPVVATTIGAEGHSLPGLTSTDDPTEFADACVRYLKAGNDPSERRRFREGVAARYGAPQVAGRLVDLWDQTLAISGGTSSGSETP